MIYVKSIVAGLAAFLIAVLASIGAAVIALFAAQPLFENSRQGMMSISAAIPLTIAVVLGLLAFVAGFRWEFRRASH
jgi:hypothetical protein